MAGMIRSMLLLLSLADGAVGASSNIWTVLAVDPQEDARDVSLADIAQVSYRYDTQEDLLWFRVSMYGTPNADTFDVNLAIDTGVDDANKANWWGRNTEFKFDKLVTARVTRVNGRYQGTISSGRAPGAKVTDIDNVPNRHLQIRIDDDNVLIGLKRSAVSKTTKMNVIASVGIERVWSDDIPNAMSMTLDLSASRPSRGLREVDLDRNNFRFEAGYKTLAHDKPAHVVRKGRGRSTLILIPGVYSGEHAFDGFIARNEARFQFYVLTPPGLNGTPARPLPPETTSYGEYPWTRRLENEIRELITREKLDRPVLVAHGFPGSLAIRTLAARFPDLVGGLIEISSAAIQPFPSPLDPKRQATLDERVVVVNEGWAKKWFKYVTPETWESNNYPAEMFAIDPQRAELARRQSEAAPLPVKIRYLSEFMASDRSSDLTDMRVPMLVLRPGFNETLLANPANSWFKSFFVESWNAFSRNDRIQLITIPNARALILDDQPQSADDAIAAFVDTNSR